MRAEQESECRRLPIPGTVSWLNGSILLSYSGTDSRAANGNELGTVLVIT